VLVAAQVGVAPSTRRIGRRPTRRRCVPRQTRRAGRAGAPRPASCASRSTRSRWPGDPLRTSSHSHGRMMAGAPTNAPTAHWTSS